jgi:hypothetical protein
MKGRGLFTRRSNVYVCHVYMLYLGEDGGSKNLGGNREKWQKN